MFFQSDTSDAFDAHPHKAAVGFACALLIGLQVLFAELSHAAVAPVLFDPANYASFANSDSAETIRPGTQITLQNWQRYKNYLPFGIQVLYSSQYRWHVDSSPEFTITVGPTVDYTWPRQYLEDTEKYGNQTRLIRLDSGGNTIENYIAGLPFPIPAEPHLADKVIYNARYGPNPTVLWWPWTAFMVDRFLNIRITSEGHAQFYRLSHLSTPSLPINPDYGKGYLKSQRSDITAPEDIKYAVDLILQPDDPTKLSERYIYVPQLRRSYRYSTAARCTYQNNSSDTTTREFSFDTANVKNTLLGEGKILALEHATADPAVLYSLGGIHVKSSVPGWTKPALGQWEVRNVYVIESVFLRDNPARKCLSHTVLYIDKDNWLPIGFEDYDADGNLWKDYIFTYMEVENRAQGGNFMILHHQTVLNLKETHASVVTVASVPKLDNDVPAEHRNAANSALPSSIMSVNR